MEIRQIGNGKVVIYIKGEDLKCLPASPQNITTNEAAEILRLALGSTYDDSWENVYFELFPGRDSLLLFALQHSGSPSFFTFSSIEPIISAARECPPGLISYLTCIDDTYILIVYPWHGDSPPAVLFEYGEEFCLPALYALHLSEHNRVLAGPTALDELKTVFG